MMAMIQGSKIQLSGESQDFIRTRFPRDKHGAAMNSAETLGQSIVVRDRATAQCQNTPQYPRYCLEKQQGTHTVRS